MTDCVCLGGLVSGERESAHFNLQGCVPHLAASAADIVLPFICTAEAITAMCSKVRKP